MIGRFRAWLLISGFSLKGRDIRRKVSNKVVIKMWLRSETGERNHERMQCSAPDGLCG